jgi:hypothetical protein
MGRCAPSNVCLVSWNPLEKTWKISGTRFSLPSVILNTFTSCMQGSVNVRNLSGCISVYLARSPPKFSEERTSLCLHGWYLKVRQQCYILLKPLKFQRDLLPTSSWLILEYLTTVLHSSTRVKAVYITQAESGIIKWLRHLRTDILWKLWRCLFTTMQQRCRIWDHKCGGDEEYFSLGYDTV